MGEATGAYLHQPGAAELRWMSDPSTYFLATGEETEGAFCLVDEQASRGESVPLHRHPDDMESFYVLEGELTLYLGDQPGMRAPAGSFAHLPGGTASRLPSRVRKGPLPHPHDTAPRAVLPRDHPRVATGGSAAARLDQRVTDQAGQRGLWRRVRRTVARSNRLVARQRR
jgi:quercetin dioxygenase-like cupin family protein